MSETEKLLICTVRCRIRGYAQTAAIPSVAQEQPFRH